VQLLAVIAPTTKLRKQQSQRDGGSQAEVLFSLASIPLNAITDRNPVEY
jgi:hypothetical protein